MRRRIRGSPGRLTRASQRGKGRPERPAQPPTLDEALAELDELIGLEHGEARGAHAHQFLKLQQRRGEAGLPDTDISLHMVFTGNPGTGKTSVARILGKIFGAMGILKKGHLVETDRIGPGGRVRRADRAADATPRSTKRSTACCSSTRRTAWWCSEGQDAYGDEAVQALLKRAEDDRARLVVILAGYPEEMDALLKTTRACRRGSIACCTFDDYSPLELARIFAFLCEKNHYKLADGDAGEADARRDGAAPAARPAFRQRPGGAEFVRARGAADGEPHRRHARSWSRSN